MIRSRWLIISLALLILVAPAMAVTRFDYMDGVYNVTIFNGTAGTDSFTVPGRVFSIDYLVVAGGGGGGGSLSGGGGGAGGLLNGTTTAMTEGNTYTITVGDGGAAATAGTNSSIDTLLMAGGGGKGASYATNGGDGGSGGGGAGDFIGTHPGGNGISGQGRNGGTGNVVSTYTGGGGGGAAAVGADASSLQAGNGGAGFLSSITGSAKYYAGGGGGGAGSGRSAGAGGSGIGGDGKVEGGGVASAGAVNTGSGGGGSGNGGGGAGGSGIVILRYYVTPVTVNAKFTSNVTSGNLTLPVQFTDQSYENPTEWNWSFTPVQGGNYSALQNPIYTFLNPGTFAVNLTVRNATGYWNSTTNNIVVGIPPVTTASFTKNVSLVYLPDYVQFTDTSTYSPSAWQWNYTKSGGVSTTFSTSQNPAYQFPSPGIYDVVLKATNYAGSSFSSSQQIIVNGFDAPRASYIITPTTGTPGALILFNDTSTVPSVAGLVYNWSFGTGSVELNPYSDFQGSVGHVYNYGGVYNINLSITNYNGTSFNFTQAGVTISTEQRMTNWYSPHQVRFRVLDANDNPIKAAYINATAYESSLPGGFAGAQQVLIEMYGINSISAAQMVSSAVQMQGYTGDDGSASFTMHGNLKYLVYVTDLSGNSFVKTFYPQMDQYLIRVTSGGYTTPQAESNILATQGNATLTFSEPNTTWCTMGVDYMDITGRTTNIAFTAYLLNNQTVMNYTSMAVTGTQHILLNYTVPNVRGQQWKWYYNATVV